MYREPHDHKRNNLELNIYRTYCERLRKRGRQADIWRRFEVARRWIRRYYDASPALTIDQITQAIMERFSEGDWFNVLEELSDRLIDARLEREKRRQRGEE